MAVSTDLASAPVRRRVSLAGLFPGQGSHTAGMRELVERVLPELAADCIGLVGEDPFARAGESTRFAQPAIFCASVATWAADREASAGRPAEPLAYAGHSLGELAALVAGEALSLEDGLRLAVLRGELMAAERDDDGTMLALLGGSEEQCEQLLAADERVVLGNDNAPGQAVLAGPREALRELSGVAREQGLRTLMLDVAGAFHSPAMAPAVEPFAAALAEVSFGLPRVKVISCASAAPFVDIRKELAGAIVQPVRWRETMGALAALGADTFVELGPGRVLARLVARNLPGAETIEPVLPDSLAGSAERAA
ncbi:MAG: ACP S-malonyltransferase [Solirubrobacteraceae bacterium]